MDKFTEKIHMTYLLVEIEKMQKTSEELKKMIDDKDPEKDYDLIKTLQDIRSTTLNTIDDKKRELKCLYNKEIEINDN